MKSSFIKYSIALLLIISAVSCSEDDSNEIEEVAKSGITNDILILVNQHRESIGLQQLVRNITADNLADEHTQYMIAENKINHNNFNTRADNLRSSENANGVGENVASGYPTAKTVVEAWLKSAGHKANIEGDFTHTGISAIKNSQGTYYFTQLFYK